MISLSHRRLDVDFVGRRVVQYAILWATLSFLLNYIPNIGSIIAAVPIIVQALLLNGFGVGMGVTVGIIVLNIVIGNIIEPKMMGKP